MDKYKAQYIYPAESVVIHTLWGRASWKMNQFEWKGRTYAIGQNDTPIVKFGFLDSDRVLIVKPEGVFMILLDSHYVQIVLEFSEEDRELICNGR
jgi:hypothetical protein